MQKDGEKRPKARYMRGTCVVQATPKLSQGRGNWRQGWSELGPVHSKSETRGPKAERNPRAEGRIHCHAGEGAAQWIGPFSGFGIRPSFGSRVSAFGFQAALRHWPG